MPGKWVDQDGYFGPNRRRRPSRRLLERRRSDYSGDPPPLGALLRRARVRLGGFAPDDHRHALDLIAAALSVASRQNLPRCAAALHAADQLLRSGGASSRSAADAKLVEAMDHYAAER